MSNAGHDHQLHRRLHGHLRRAGRFGEAHITDALGRTVETRQYASPSPTTRPTAAAPAPSTPRRSSRTPGRQAGEGHRPGQQLLDLGLRPVRPSGQKHRPGQGHRDHRLRQPGPALVDQGRAPAGGHHRLRQAAPPHRHLQGGHRRRPDLHHRGTDPGQPAHAPSPTTPPATRVSWPRRPVTPTAPPTPPTPTRARSPATTACTTRWTPR
ncbi:hypothetical protein E4K10_04360 [Streptomyces sp. T1317-0309]|nr:hypothetical protein E4K10_04360 [Streptomyces sp. T1317-0309]